MNTDDEVPLAPKAQTGDLYKQSAPQPQQAFVHNAYAATIQGCQGIILQLGGVANAVLAFLIEQKVKNPNRRWQADEIARALGYNNSGTVSNALSKELKSGSTRAGDIRPSRLEQVCGDCISIINSQVRLLDGGMYNKGYALINHIPVTFIRGSKELKLQPDPA